jgi:steroid 5-alpha reductase family enzyme
MTHAQWALVWDNVWLMLAVAALCFVVGTVTGNVSQVDKLWSIMPVVYVWIVAGRSHWPARLVLMAILVTVWGARLTYNFSRLGGYSWKFWSGHEDYRWAHLRQWPVLNTRAGWAAFHLLFICFYQMALILWFTLPIVSVRGTSRGLEAWDVVLAVVFIALVGFETYADQLQWTFQNEKKRRRQEGEPLTDRYATGFIHDGVWGHTRHPNYLAEQSIWIVFLLFAVTATHKLDWTALGALLLLGLFQGSSRMSESIQLKRYPAYAAYQRQVPRFVPRPRAKVNVNEFA